MNSKTGSGYGQYTPPKQEKRHPLTRQDTRTLYEAAVEYPDREVELICRSLLDYGLRVGELAHMRSHWIGQEYSRQLDQKLWRIKVPRVEHCWGGTGEHEEAGNPNGANLHETNSPCSDCRSRSWKAKIAPKIDGERRPKLGFVTESEAEEYDYAPKSKRSATKVWQFPGLPESGETAKLLKQFLQAQEHKQWPHGGNAIRSRLDKLVESTLPDDPEDPKEGELILPDRSTNKIVPHGLRHTYGCRLIEASIGEGAAMKQMRHQSPEVFRWYSDVRGTRVVSALANAVSDADGMLHDT